MSTRTVTFTEHENSFIDTSIAEGRFSNTSEAVSAGLRLLERQEAEDQEKVASLRATTQEAFAALDRGEGIALPSADDIDAFVNAAVEDARSAQRTTHA